jgi:hypothetical protein
MNKHTPGPWHVSEEWDGTSIRAGMFHVTHTIQSCGFHTDEEDKAVKQANARLIAAAPNLLEALKRIMYNDCLIIGNPSHIELVKHWEYEKSQGCGEADDRLFALAAIAKATGVNA